MPTGSEIQITSESGIETDVATDGDWVAWADRSGANHGVWLRNMMTGVEQRVGNGDYPDIAGSHVVWSDAGVWDYNAHTGTARKVGNTFATGGAAVSEEYVVWTSGGHLYGYSLVNSSAFDFALPSRPGYTTPYASSPSIDGNMVAWVQSQTASDGGEELYDLYTMLVPEPDTLLVLAVAISGLCFRRERSPEFDVHRGGISLTPSGAGGGSRGRSSGRSR